MLAVLSKFCLSAETMNETNGAAEPLHFKATSRCASRGKSPEYGAFTKKRLALYVALQRNSRALPSEIDRLVEIHPHFRDFDVGLIYFPGIVAGFVLP